MQFYLFRALPWTCMVFVALFSNAAIAVEASATTKEDKSAAAEKGKKEQPAAKDGAKGENTQKPVEFSFPQGKAIEFFYLNQISDTDANKLVWDYRAKKYVYLSKCSNIIIESVGNEPIDQKDPSENIPAGKFHYVRLSRPLIDTFFRISKTAFGFSGSYDCIVKDAAHDSQEWREYQTAESALAEHIKKSVSPQSASSSDRDKDKTTQLEISVKTKKKNTLVEPVDDNLYLIDDSAINKLPHADVGIAYGLVAVPFKKYTSGSAGSIKDSASIGAYLGYKNFFPEWGGLSITPVVTFGYSTQKFDALDQNGKWREYSAGVMSYSIGAIFGLSYDNFRFGLLYGQDQRKSVDPNAPSFNGKWWSFMFGIGLDGPSIKVPNQK